MTDTLTTLSADITPLEDNRVRLAVAVPEDVVRRCTQETIRGLAKNMRIPGFRPGKAPGNVIIQRLGKEYVAQKTVEDHMGHWYSDALDAGGVDPIDEPEIDFDGPPESGPLTFTATVQVRPKATLGEYKALEVGKAEPAVDEEAVTAEIERLREQASRLEVVERPAAAGDFLTIDFEGKADGVAVENGSGRDYLLEIGGPGVIAGFDEHLIGKSTDETIEFPITYADDDQRPALAGQTVNYSVTIKRVQQKVLPPLDDTLATQVSEFDTLAELEADLRQRSLEKSTEEAEENYRRVVLDSVTKEATVEVPEVMIRRRVNEILHETSHRLPKGISLEDYIRVLGKTPEQIVEELKPDAEMSIRRELVVEAVAEAEGIVITDEDVEEQIRKDAEDADRDAEVLIADVRKHKAFETIRADMARARTVTFLVESAVPISVEQAQAREKLWTPESKEPDVEAAKLWTPGDPEPESKPPARGKKTT
jgi:trigger factor